MSMPPPSSPPPWEPSDRPLGPLPADAPWPGRPGGGPILYGTPTWGPTLEHPNGTTVLVLGILSLVVCGLLGPFAWSMGTKALREMDAQPGVQFSNRANITAGRICGMVATGMLALGVLFLVVVITAAASGL